jgi:hypothetical protein
MDDGNSSNGTSSRSDPLVQDLITETRKYEYLLKAMLAHGASHLGLTTTDELGSQGLNHRIDAMTLLNKALSRPATSKEEYDARFATFMILTFQSTCLHDGLIDFITMLRGCVLNGQFGEGSFFTLMSTHGHLKTIKERSEGLEMTTFDGLTLSEAVSSLMKFKPLCKTASEKRYHQILMDVAVQGYSSPNAGKNMIS